ncbi:MAG: transketolase [Spirochaetes bacterium]|nr:transketolase [Spirochaetota bacterium]
MIPVDITRISQMADGIRMRVLAHTIKNNGGYLCQACSSAEIFATLYSTILRLAPVEKPIMPWKFPGVPGNANFHYRTGIAFHGEKLPHLDRFYLSPSQYSLVMYAALIEAGRMDKNALDEFNRDGSILEMIGAEHSPGMEIMTGSLGQGISQVAGIAWARKRKAETGRNVLFMSDGEFQIGQTWEAIQTMSFYKLDNILIYVDINGYQCDGKVETVMNIEPLHKRLEAFGAHVVRINGHDIEKLIECSNLSIKEKPTIVLCDTDPCRGMDFLRARAPKFHYIRFTSENERNEFAKFLSTLGNNIRT